MQLKLGITFLLSILFITSSYAYERAFYVLRNSSPAHIVAGEKALALVKAHHKSIDILIAQAYTIDQNGVVWGFVDPNIFSFAKTNHIKMMAMITNSGFNPQKAHQFLTDSAAQTRSLKAILEACLKNQYYGVQFDFEMISFDDRTKLTDFYKKAAELLHANKFAVSIAVGPLVSNNPQASEFLKRSYTVWQGAYDFKALALFSDFITIMSYNQHTAGTTPGPVASFPWVAQTVKYALRYIPAKKISLGIPAYSSYWYTGKVGKRINMHMNEIAYEKVSDLIKKYHTHLRWDEVNKVNYAAYESHWLDEYIYAEDGSSFKAKLSLVKKNHLRGISVFRLGTEDPKLWKVLNG